MLPLLAQVAGYSIVHWVIMIIVIAAVVAIMHIVLGKMGVAIPDWVVQIFWIIVLAVVGILAIKFIFSLG